MKQLAGYLLIISMCTSFSFLGCSSGVDSQFFPDFGLREGDAIRIEITGTRNTKWLEGQRYKTTSLDKGAAIQLSLVGYDVEGNSNSTLSATWTSSNPQVAVVDNTGNVTALAAGDAEITVKLLSTVTGEVISDTLVVTVLPSPVSGKKWVTADVTLPQSIWDHASAVWNGYLYVAGGNSSCTTDFDNCGFTDKVYFAPVKQDGSIGAFSETTVLPRYLRGHSMLANNGYMYIIGGIVQPFYPEPPYPDPNNHKTILSEKVYYSKINPDGSLGLWQETTPLPPPEELLPEQKTPDKGGLFALSAVVQTVTSNGEGKGYIYVTGGWNDAIKKNVNTVLVGPINSDGSISTWIHNAQSDLPYNLSKHTSVTATINGVNYIYVMGGNSGDLGSQRFHNEILYAKIENDGILSSWRYSSRILPAQLIDHASASFGNYIFVFGGRDGDGGNNEQSQFNTYSSAVYYPIDGSGDLHPLQRFADLPAPLFHHAAVADINTSASSINIYVTGGAGGNTSDQNNRKNTIYYLTATPPP